MKASFNGARINLARAYNSVANKLMFEPVIDKDDLVSEMNDLQSAIGCLLCMYENGNNDAKDLSEDVKLIEVE